MKTAVVPVLYMITRHPREWRLGMGERQLPITNEERLNSSREKEKWYKSTKMNRRTRRIKATSLVINSGTLFSF
jgi:hypothetical protein